MVEKIHHPPSPELLRVIKESVFITHPDELADQDQAFGLCVQISTAITSYNRTHQNEMLEKSPDELFDQFQNGLSVMMIHQNGGSPEAIFHATAYPALTPIQSDKLGFQVFEAGSVITMDPYRNYGIGKTGSDRLAYLISEKSSQIPIWLATNKQAKAFLAMTHGAGMEGADYYQFPYLTNLTCSCSNCSELFGHSCTYRRPSKSATPSDFLSIAVTENNGHMPCTLIVSNLQVASDFENACRQASLELGVPPIPAGQINVDIMTQVSHFYRKLNGQ